MTSLTPVPTSLDGWYLGINSIYLNRNFYRDASSIFAHLVEIVGGLSLLATEKQKAEVTPDRYIPKAVAWWMALCGKVGVRSIEAMIWAKFPYACPYCHLKNHKRLVCLEKRKTPPSPDWRELEVIGEGNSALRPTTVDDWLEMFGTIYPAADTEQYPATFGRLCEELGELAEAMRVFPVAPGYFLSEAADVFAWLMHLHAVVSAKREAAGQGRLQRLQEGLSGSYPARCRDCDRRVCACPPILPKTLGRIAHEVRTAGSPFVPGGALLSTAEALALFSLGTREVTLGHSQVAVTEDLLRGIQALVETVLADLQQQQSALSGVSKDVVATLTAVQQSINAQRLTQEQLNELTSALQAMPSETRSTMLNFLTNIAAAPWSAALLELLR